MIGAYRLDTDVETVYQFTKSVFSSLVNQQTKVSVIDPISEFQQYAHKKISSSSPTYHVLRQLGPDHKPEFEMAVDIKGKIYGKGKGRSKKEAKKQAAIDALEKLKLKHQSPLLDLDDPNFLKTLFHASESCEACPHLELCAQSYMCYLDLIGND